MKLTDAEENNLLVDFVREIAALHLPEADTYAFWESRDMDSCFTVLMQDVQLARETLKKLGIK